MTNHLYLLFIYIYIYYVCVWGPFIQPQYVQAPSKSVQKIAPDAGLKAAVPRILWCNG